jgi:hypothetical protein
LHPPIALLLDFALILLRDLTLAAYTRMSCVARGGPVIHPWPSALSRRRE